MTSLFDTARHIAIEGPIGVGKSSLARRLAAWLGAELLLEGAGENPFLERFYDDLPGYAFQTQIFFLFQRLRQMQGLAQRSMFSSRIVADYLFAKDALFAQLNLSDDEYRAYAQLHARAAPQVPEPDLVIWLQAPPATLLQRIQRRGLSMERGITTDYLQRLCDGYAEFFAGYCGAPVFAVGTERMNLVGSDADFERLVDALRAFDQPRGLLDPGPDETTITLTAPLPE